MPNGVLAWGINSSLYVQEAVRNCEDYLKTNYPDDYKLTKYAPNPFPMDYEPSMDVSALLEAEEASYYQSIIGILRWMVELGRVDIATEVSQLASCLAMPRKGHLVNALHIMSYLKIKHNSMLILGPTYPEIKCNDFKDRED